MRRVTGLVCLLGSAAFLAACGEDRRAELPAATSSPAANADDAAPALAPVAPVDYSSATTWLCRPDTADACEQPATATSIAPDGKLTKDAFVPDPAAAIDCFYVYPTVSRDETPNSDTTPGAEELEVARQQLARFGSVCRLYAPMYRQVTLGALRQMLAGEQPATNREMAYADVKAAWDHYLASDNAGRGVVLIGHSQGAGLLTRLIAAEIDGKPAQDRLVSALLIGTNLAVADPHEGGGSFRNIPLCRSAADTRCAISYVSFRASTPPPAASLFGKADEQGMHAACVNPAELDGSGGQLKAMLPATSAHESTADPLPWTTDGAAIDTPFVMLPGMLSATCVDQGGFSYLAVTIASDPADMRTDAIVGDVVTDGVVQPGWGLHLVDMNLALGNLVDIVKRQGDAWAAAHPVAQTTLPKPR
jgi:hypothetical protein